MWKYIENSKEYYVSPTGDVIGTKGKVLNPGLSSTGYYIVVVCYEDGTKKTKPIHRLVAESFLPPPPPEKVSECLLKGAGKVLVNHKDGDKLNNNLDNLEWATYQENYDHAIVNGLLNPLIGEDSRLSTVSNEDIHEVCRLLQEGCRNIDIVNSMGISRSIVDQVRSGLNWKHISKDYDFPKRSRRRSISDATARWVCHCLEKGLGQGEIMKLSTCKSLTVGVIKTIRRKNAYHHITKDFNF